jgi:hypothetical protein
MFGEIGRGAASHRAISDQPDRKLSLALVTLRIFSAPARFLCERSIIHGEIVWKYCDRGLGEEERREWAAESQIRPLA